MSPFLKPEEFAEQMRAIASAHDPESSHMDADDLMCELLKSLGYGAGVEIFEDMGKWYS